MLKPQGTWLRSPWDVQILASPRVRRHCPRRRARSRARSPRRPTAGPQKRVGDVEIRARCSMCCSATGACLRRDDTWQSAAETGNWGYYCEQRAAACARRTWRVRIAGGCVCYRGEPGTAVTSGTTDKNTNRRGRRYAAPERLAAEFLGTFWLVLGGCGSAVLAAAFPTWGSACWE